MRRQPQAREEDFRLAAVARPGLIPGTRVVDVPAGGEYLADHLPDACHYDGHEPCGDFEGREAETPNSLLPLPWEDGAADVACSIAGVHHLADKGPLLAELWRVTRPGGRLVLADVETESAVAWFLDGFVGRHNRTGHEGIYLDGAFAGDLARGGWRQCRAEHLSYYWRFPDLPSLGAFCRDLFGLEGIGVGEVVRAAEEGLGVDDLGEGVGLRWSWTYWVAEKPGPGR